MGTSLGTCGPEGHAAYAGTDPLSVRDSRLAPGASLGSSSFGDETDGVGRLQDVAVGAGDLN